MEVELDDGGAPGLTFVDGLLSLAIENLGSAGTFNPSLAVTLVYDNTELKEVYPFEVVVVACELESVVLEPEE